MKQDVQQRIVALKNEVKAQKTYSGLAYSQLLMPENTPTQSYSGTASLSGSGETPVARIRFRFQRTDGIITAPMINFAYDASITPTYKQYAESYGWTFQGTGAATVFPPINWTSGNIAELGDGYVDFYVNFSNEIRVDFFDLNSISFNVTCQAITNVKGTLSVERLI